MGSGLALAFSVRFGGKLREPYEAACRAEALSPGKIQVVHIPPRIILNMATKGHWKNPSRIEWIDAGLKALVDVIAMCNIQSIALPAVGCGLGGLSPKRVEALVEKHLHNLDCRVDCHGFDQR